MFAPEISWGIAIIFKDIPSILVGGWTNPFEKYVRQKMGIFLKFGLKIKNTLWETNIAGWNISILDRKYIFKVQRVHFPASYVSLADCIWKPPAIFRSIFSLQSPIPYLGRTAFSPNTLGAILSETAKKGWDFLPQKNKPIGFKLKLGMDFLSWILPKQCNREI